MTTSGEDSTRCVRCGHPIPRTGKAEKCPVCGAKTQTTSPRGPITIDEIKRIVDQHALEEYSYSQCPGCQAKLFYAFRDGRVWRDRSCDCKLSWAPLLELVSWEEFAEFFNQQSPVVRGVLWESFLAA